MFAALQYQQSLGEQVLCIGTIFDYASVFHLGAGLPATLADLLSCTGVEIIAWQADTVARTARVTYLYGKATDQVAHRKVSSSKDELHS